MPAGRWDLPPEVATDLKRCAVPPVTPCLCAFCDGPVDFDGDLACSRCRDTKVSATVLAALREPLPENRRKIAGCPPWEARTPRPPALCCPAPRPPSRPGAVAMPAPRCTSGTTSRRSGEDGRAASALARTASPSPRSARCARPRGRCTPDPSRASLSSVGHSRGLPTSAPPSAASSPAPSPSSSFNRTPAVRQRPALQPHHPLAVPLAVLTPSTTCLRPDNPRWRSHLPGRDRNLTSGCLTMAAYLCSCPHPKRIYEYTPFSNQCGPFVWSVCLSLLPRGTHGLP